MESYNQFHQKFITFGFRQHKNGQLNNITMESKINTTQGSGFLCENIITSFNF